MTEYGTKLALAIEIAVSVHSHQVDKVGQPFIGHPLRTLGYATEMLPHWGPEYDKNMLWPGREVALKDFTLCAAVLHDTLEDGEFPLVVRSVIEASFDRRVVDIVDAMTRREGESYRNYMKRVLANPFARIVKRADITDNMDPRRGWAGSPTSRYEQALRWLDGTEVP
jgi:(p)ppGpp synthase/HD superfamily hydrolase